MTDKIQKIREEVEKRYEYWKEKESNSHSIESEIRMSECQHLLLILDSLQEEPVKLKINKEKFRKEVEKLKSNLIYGACSSQIAMETMCKEEAYNEVLAILDTMQEEPVSEELEEAANNALNNVLNTHEIVNVRSCLEMFRFGAKWKKEQMMAKAVDAELYSDGMLTPLIGVKDKEKISNIKFGDKIKLIIIKDE